MISSFTFENCSFEMTRRINATSESILDRNIGPIEKRPIILQASAPPHSFFWIVRIPPKRGKTDRAIPIVAHI